MDLENSLNLLDTTAIVPQVIVPRGENMSLNPFEEFSKCQSDFVYFAKTYLKIVHPKRGLIPFELHPYQERLIKTYEQHPSVILKKFRQGGFTTLTVLWCLWKCMFVPKQRIFLVSKTDREAIHVGKIVDLAINNFPDWFKPRMTKQNDHEKHFAVTDSSFCFYTFIGARSRSLNWLIIDDAAFIPDMEEHWKAMFPTISSGGKVIVMSTVNGVGNWFEGTYYDALSNKNSFHVFQSDYTEHPEFNNSAWVADMKKNLGERAWRQEFLGEFLGKEDKNLVETMESVKSLDNLELSLHLKFIARQLNKKKNLASYCAVWEASERLNILSHGDTI